MKRNCSFYILLVLILLSGNAADAQIRVPGNSPRWVDTGINVENGTLIRITASGRVDVGARGALGPEGTTAFPGDRRLSFPSDVHPLYGLVLRFTSSQTNPEDELREDYALPPNGEICSGSSGHLWLIVNDDVRADNTGEFVANITIESCAPRSTNFRETRIRVADEQNANVKDTEVFVNGRRVGVTNVNGILRLPPLSVGDRIVARSGIHENRTYRSNHQTGSSQNWNYRVYLTTAAVRNDGIRADFAVVNPLETQELRLDRANPLFGLHILASVEWDASVVELENFRDTMLAPMSQFLYNATDGQFFVEQIELVDNAAFWDDTDFRIHANLEVRPNVSLRAGGFLHNGLGTWANMRRAPTLTPDFWASHQTAAHEFGHYGLDLGDEYADGNDSVFCAAKLGASGQFGNYQPRASCMMYLQSVAGKICSGHGDNPHRTGTGQGDENCWLHLANQYRDGSDRLRARWLIKTPDTRAAIPGTLSELPAGWQPRTAIDNRSRPNLCQPLTMTVVNAETRTPMNDVEVWVRSASGQNILQGKSGSYDAGSGRMSLGSGNLPLTGFHAGDRVTANGGEYVITAADCAATARLDERFTEKSNAGWFMTRASFSPFSTGDNAAPQKSIVLPVVPEPFALTANVEPLKNGQFQIKTNAAPMRNAPQVFVTPQGGAGAEKVSMTFDEAGKTYVGTTGKLSDVASVNVEIIAEADGKFVKRLFSVVVSPLNPNGASKLFSADGQFSLDVPAGVLPANARLSISPSSVEPPNLDSVLVLVSGGYHIASSAGSRLKGESVVRFQLPNRRGPRAADGFDAKTFEILRYNPQSQRWEGLSGTFLSAVDVISVRANQLGDYAVVARVANVEQKPNGNQTNTKFAVTSAVLKADQADNSGKCPVSVKFNGSITTNGPGTVKYTFTRSDGTTSPVFTLEFEAAGTKPISTNWTLGDTNALPRYEGWRTVKILAPNEIESNRKTGMFSMSCNW